MNDTAEIAVELDDNVLDRLASLICGDDSTPYYRPGYKISAFLEAAGWRRVGEVEGPRRAWVSDMLKRRRRDSQALQGVILRLADPREYLDEDDVRVLVVKELNQLLAVEGYQVVYSGSRPKLVERPQTMQRPEMREPIELVADLGDIVSDAEFGKHLRARLDEAHTCWSAGACTAAIIMLGSLLEGVLYEFAISRRGEGPRPSDHLESLINLAQEKKWIAKDVSDYAHVLRDHRNLVHPKKQITQGYTPEDDTVRIAWNVVVAALNDLAEAG
ncbi:hypothetical protein LWC34_08625 [Kibdelosporangium philippinense]|uniref:DUF4145 domain-containing protein n=1 Tax=Kibdelosporangium philippinense TaxID=211113 RepID=A0ABS8Z4X3_9PSEU|nr:hypothetical protein [Kibdelosporangium philippinense]MCE7002895.1 hypothetical protein [Kibdelosporangium philippinense]